ncbi:MAG TPA: accessory Sec system protein Asp3 [Jatrophihabitans sp.]|jgi:accessory Sec system protein Asp3
MAHNEIETVGWGSPNSQASLYGSALTVETSGAAHLVNHLMPGGTTIQEWYSFTDYQSMRDTPVLPLLHHGKTYRLVPRVVSVPEDTFIVEVRYFDRFDELVRTDVLYPPEYEFEYPVECHYYTIRLVNGGCDELRFTSLTLLEVGADG